MTLKKICINDIIIIGEYMNNYEVHYKNNLYIIDVIGKKNILNNDLNIINITIKNKDYSFNLGNFYTELPYLITDEFMFNFIRDLIDNIDEIIFKRNRYFGEDENIKNKLGNKTKIDKELEKIYFEFIKMNKKTKEYVKYSRFLELYFYGHNIPDAIRYIYLKNRKKSILDYKNIDDTIKYSFSYNISDLKDESEFKKNKIILAELKKDLNLKEEELNILNEIILLVESIINKHTENDNINLNIEKLECELKSISFFDKNRNKIKNKLRNLKSEVVEIDVTSERKKIYDEYKKYAEKYGDKHGVLILFDKLNFDDILSLLESVFSSKESIYLSVVEKINALNEEISGYNDNTVDISDLYERLEG